MDADSLNLIGVDDLRANPNFAQFDGSGPTTTKYSIAVLGTGAQLNHPAFGPDVVAPFGIADRIVHQQNFREPAQNANEVDQNGVGTGVAHVIADMALGVNLIILKVFNPGDSATQQAPTIAQALDWVRNNREIFNIVAVQLAFNVTQPLYQELSDPINQEAWVVAIDPPMQQLEAQGVAVITQAGNTHHNFIDGLGNNL